MNARKGAGLKEEWKWMWVGTYLERGCGLWVDVKLIAGFILETVEV